MAKADNLAIVNLTDTIQTHRETFLLNNGIMFIIITHTPKTRFEARLDDSFAFLRNCGKSSSVSSQNFTEKKQIIVFNCESKSIQLF